MTTHPTAADVLRQARDALAAYRDAFERHYVTNTHGARDFDFTGHIAKLSDVALAAIDALPADPVPAAPAEPTPEMLHAVRSLVGDDAHKAAIWRAMWAAQPAPQASAPSGEPAAKPCEWTNCPTRVGDVCCNDRATTAPAPLPADTLSQQLQQRCVDWGVYWRASDAHGVDLSHEQALELLRNALGVEVAIAAPLLSNGPETGATASVAGPLNGIAATMFHGEGAIAQCGSCKRYTMNPAALTPKVRCVCDCGDEHGWSGSFKKPGPDAQWFGAAPQAAPSQERGE